MKRQRMRHKKISPQQLSIRRQIEAELSQIAPMCSMARRLATLDGFIDYFYSMMELYDPYEEAYERLEEFYEQIFGKRRYSEYNSFRVMATRWMERHQKGGEI